LNKFSVTWIIYIMRSRISKCFLGISFFGLAIAALPASSSPLAHTELICHTKNADECYPRIFQPTKDFQIIKEDQDLPPGLHVRMNIWTGEKEARLNIPMEGEEDASPEVVTEQAVVIVDQPESEEPIEDSEPAMRDRVRQKPPVYEAAGKIQPPIPAEGNNNDASSFQRALLTLSKAPNNRMEADVESALSALADLSHDIYYGVELVKNKAALLHLVDLIVETTTVPTPERRLAASVLGHALQNNPTALKEALESYPSAESLMTEMYKGLKAETDAVAAKAKIYALSGLTKDQGMRDTFLEQGGMKVLLKIFLNAGDSWEGARIKVTEFVMDTFLDADMGAEVGVWPKGPVEDEAVCHSANSRLQDGCWEFHIKNSGKGEWVDNLLRGLGSVRNQSSKGPADREL
jgi:nucleotide exchange factor SIL1